MHALDAGLLVNALSGALMVALGIVVAAVRRASPANRAFALFAIPFGTTYVLDNLHLWAGHPSLPAAVGVGGLLATASVGLAGVARAFPRPLEPADRRRVLVAVAVGVVVLSTTLALQFWSGAWAGLRGQGWEALPTAGQLAYWAGFWAFHATAWAVLVLFALRHAALAGLDARAADGLRLMSLALVLYPAFYVARETMVVVDWAGWSVGVALGGLAFIVAPTLLLAALWLRSSYRSPTPKAARTVAWVVLAAAVVGIPGLGLGGNHPGFGLSRTLGVLLLAYAIVRHQFLGIDVKLRWGLSRSTVAAAFVAVFFVASEGAQILFGRGNEWFGLVAAGALVFAIAPLQRAAERLAEKAVPVANAPAGAAPGHSIATYRAAVPGSRIDDGEDAYRRAVRLTLRAPSLTRDEERDLLVIATRLGITPERAFDIRNEVEREPRGAQREAR